MKSISYLLTVAALASVTPACGDGDATNPSRLYLALLNSELTVRLSEQEPDPF